MGVQGNTRMRTSRVLALDWSHAGGSSIQDHSLRVSDVSSLRNLELILTPSSPEGVARHSCRVDEASICETRGCGMSLLCARSTQGGTGRRRACAHEGLEVEEHVLAPICRRDEAIPASGERAQERAGAGGRTDGGHARGEPPSSRGERGPRGGRGRGRVRASKPWPVQRRARARRGRRAHSFWVWKNFIVPRCSGNAIGQALSAFSARLCVPCL